MPDLNQKVDTWKNKLLDMGLRNKLLNYRETKRATLQIKYPKLEALWESFVLKERPLVFPLAKEEEETPSPLAEESGEETLPASSEEDPGGIITDQSPREREATLRNLRNKAGSFIEEQGINALYLSFGFLQWTEAEHSHESHNAPLILVPVTLKWESVISPFILELHEDEIVLNPTLVYKLKNDFGITLPEFDPDEPPEEYFARVEEKTALWHWSVLRSVSLGMLSFLKISMYEDLEKHRDAISANPVIRAICGDGGGITQDISDVDHFDFDHKMKPEESFSVVDADSSQQDALLCAKRGISFVLQGPPGTGKSQTITNIIAECLADGKKVLFVSEKMAALDVVYQRLKNADLSDFCLVLHSYKANRKQMLDQLGSVLSMADKKATVSEEAFRSLQRLSSDRDELNRYSEDIEKVIEPLHKSIFEVNGILSGVMDCEDAAFAFPDVRQTTAQQYDVCINLLQNFVDRIGMQKIDYHINPWRGAAAEYISYELRQDIRIKTERLQRSLDGVAELFSDICGELSITLPDSPDGVKTLCRVLHSAAKGVQFQSRWLFPDRTKELLLTAETAGARKEKFLKCRQNLKSQIGLLGDLDGTRVPKETLRDDDIDSLSLFRECLKRQIAEDCVFKIWADEAVYARAKAILQEAKSHWDAYRDLRKQILDEYEKEILEIPVSELYFRFKAESTAAFKFLNGTYRTDKKQMQSLYRGTKKKLSDEDILQVLGLLREMADQRAWTEEHRAELTADCPGYVWDEQTDFDAVFKREAVFEAMTALCRTADETEGVLAEDQKEEEALRADFGELYRGIETDWEAVRASLTWTKTLASLLGDYLPKNQTFLDGLSAGRTSAEKCAGYAALLQEKGLAMQEEYEWFCGLFTDGADFAQMRMPALMDRIGACSDNFAALEEWIDFKNIRKQCGENGLGGYLEILDEQNIPREHIIPVFQKRFFRLWLDCVLPEYPSVANFRRINQDKTIEEFRQLDTLQFQIASSRIRCKLISDLPSMDRFTAGVDEIGILKRELKKQRKGMPVRRLFQEIPDLITTLKPCLMMSPLSVSMYLESDAYLFDTVIFDEASQVFTENAIGAICRGKQVIIAGDSRQLPPTNFFTAASGSSDFSDDEEEDEDEGAFESILDEAALLPERTLLWHYRSRHEHLIAFSNAKIYHNSLITFPSYIDRAADIGVEYIFVPDGFYDRGGRKGNVPEAQKVAETVFAHFRRHPDRSLGVITFGQVQQLAVDTALRKMRMEHPEYEMFFSEDRREPFFVKSLENVQGDERDTILLSIGYGKDIHGVMRMNFGPLSNAGGERRLNVAVTRAKYNLKLIGSILPTDLDLSRVTAEGPKLLRSYIEFAQRGPAALADEITEEEGTRFESPFEESVYRYLDKRGYKLATQVGCSGYRIDIAVKHNRLPGRYVLGIECDGAAYHSARTARERDRLRQDVLESIGWKIYRIWSTDWIKDPESEGRKLIDAVEEAMLQYHEQEPVSADSPQEMVPPREIKEQKEADTAKKPELQKNFLHMEEKPIRESDQMNPYHFEEYPDLSALSDRASYIRLPDFLLQVIEAAYPIHFDDLCRAALPHLRKEKVSSTVRGSVSDALVWIRWKVVKEDQFYVPILCDPQDIAGLPHRRAGGRTIKSISVWELASGMLAVAKTCIGTTKEGLTAETAKAFGFSRIGSSISAAMSEAYDLLLEKGYIREIGSKVKVEQT